MRFAPLWWPLRALPCPDASLKLQTGTDLVLMLRRIEVCPHLKKYTRSYPVQMGTDLKYVHLCFLANCKKRLLMTRVNKFELKKNNNNCLQKYW